MIYDNYWFSTHKPSLSHSLHLPKEVDVAIIGGGFGGIALLFQLLRNKITNVALLEADTVGFGNTARSSGQITLTGGAKYFSQYKDKKFAKLYLDLTLKSIKQLTKSLSDLDCDFEQSGGMHLAKTKSELQFFKDEVEFLNQSNVQAVMLNAEDVTNLIGSKVFAGGMFVPCEATLNPYKMLFKTKGKLHRLSHLVHQNAKVEYVDGDSLLISQRGVLKAKRVVYCSGLSLLPKLKNKTQNVFHQVAVSKPGNVPQINAVYNYNAARMRTHGGRFILENISRSRKIVDEALLQKQLKEMPLKMSHVCSYNEVVGKDGVPLIGEIEKGHYVMMGYDLSHTCLAASMMLNILKGNKVNKDFDPMRDM